MNSKSYLLSCLIGLCLSSVLRADPLVIFPNGDFFCGVKVTAHPPVDRGEKNPDKQVPAPELLLKNVEITQVGKLRKDILTYNDGRSSEIWIAAGAGVVLVVADTHQNGAVYPANFKDLDSTGFRLLRLDAASVTWITDKSLAGTVDFKGKKAQHYQAVQIIMTPYDRTMDLPGKSKLFQAWIDQKTLIPLGFDDGDALYELNFGDKPPVGPLIMPATLEKMMQKYLNATGLPRRL